jgi:hypothetical protein
MLISNIYISLGLILPIKGYEPEIFFTDFLKKGEAAPKSQVTSMKMTSSDATNQRTVLYRFQAPVCKNVEFCTFFARRKITKKDHGCVFFFQG